MKYIITIALTLFAFGFITACESPSEEAPAVEAQTDEVEEQEAPAEAAADQKGPKIQGERPETRRVLEEKFEKEAKERINPDNVDSILEELEKEIEAELAELDD